MYMILTYGYDAENNVNNIKTIEEAREKLIKMSEEWCDNHDIDIDDTYYSEYDNTFTYGIEEKGSITYTIFEVPEFKNEIEELLFTAKIEIWKAICDADDYVFSLSDNCVELYGGRAIDFIDDALKLINQEE